MEFDDWDDWVGKPMFRKKQAVSEEIRETDSGPCDAYDLNRLMNQILDSVDDVDLENIHRNHPARKYWMKHFCQRKKIYSIH